MWKASSKSEFAAKFSSAFPSHFVDVGSVEIGISSGGNRVQLISAVFSPSKVERKEKQKNHHIVSEKFISEKFIVMGIKTRSG